MVPRNDMQHHSYRVAIGVRKEVEVDGRQVLLFWYRNQIYAIGARSPAEGAYSEGFIKAKFTQAWTCMQWLACHPHGARTSLSSLTGMHLGAGHTLHLGLLHSTVQADLNSSQPQLTRLSHSVPLTSLLFLWPRRITASSARPLGHCFL